MGELAHYSPEDVIISIAGLVTLDGFIDGTFVKITKDRPMYETKQSADGRTTKIKKSGGTYSVEVTLMSTSTSNDILTNIVRVDNRVGGIFLPLFIKDSSGRTLFFSTSSWLEEYPVIEFSTEVTARTWVFKAAEASVTVGGNSSPSGLLLDVFNVGQGFL